MYSNINTKNLYFVSPKKDISILYPRIPDSRELFENDNIKRICFSNNIDKCIIATTQHHLKKKLYIYNIKYVLRDNKLVKRSLGVSNKNIIKNKLVDDAHLTNEIWVCEPVILNIVGEIKLDRRKIITIKSNIFNNRRDEELIINIPKYKITLY
jgi:hypothetical protein